MRVLVFISLLAFIACTEGQPPRHEYIETHDRPEQIEEAIRDAAIVQSMTKADVRAAWGEPDTQSEIHNPETGYTEAQWCYRRETLRCVHFEKGYVTGWN